MKETIVAIRIRKHHFHVQYIPAGGPASYAAPGNPSGCVTAGLWRVSRLTSLACVLSEATSKLLVFKFSSRNYIVISLNLTAIPVIIQPAVLEGSGLLRIPLVRTLIPVPAALIIDVFIAFKKFHQTH